MMNNKWILLKMDGLLGCVSWLPFLKDGSLMGKCLEYGDSSSCHRLKENKAVIIQRGWRRLIPRRRLERIKYEKAAITLQLSWKQLLARKQLQKLKKISNEAALTFQSDWRKMIARRKLQKLKREAIVKLREEVKELKHRLELEKNVRELLENEKKSNNDMLKESKNENEKLLKQLEDSKNENDLTSARLEETISQLKAEKKVILDTLAFLKPQEKKKSDEKPRRSSSDRHKEREELLIQCISQEIGFSNRRPIGACIVYKCLLHWGSFESEKTTIFNRIVQAIDSIIEDQESIGLLTYWLTNSIMLLSLLQPIFKSGETMSTAPTSASGSPTSSSGSHNRRKTAPTSFWGRFSQSMRIPQSPSSTISLSNRSFTRSGTRHYEAKDPTIFFKNQVSEFIQKIFGDLKGKLRNEISPVLDLCIKNTNESEENPTGTGDAIAQWKILEKILEKYLKTMEVNYVPMYLINKLFSETFSYINMKLFNSLLSQPECCSFSNGRHLKDGLFELNKWLSKSLNKDKDLDQMNHINQAVAFLLTDELQKKTLKDIRDEICPSFNIGQLYKLSTMYYDEKSNAPIISSEVISSMRSEMEEPEFSDNNYLFLLEEEEEYNRFSEEDFSSTIKSMPIDISDVEPPPLIQHNSQFSFIKKTSISE